MPNERTAADRLTTYAAIEVEQARHARETADALFNPKRLIEVGEDQNSRPESDAATKQQPGRVLRILATAPPQPDPASDLVAGIPPSEYGRIRTLVTHGLTVSQVAEIYAVAQSEIQRIVRKPPRAHRLR